MATEGSREGGKWQIAIDNHVRYSFIKHISVSADYSKFTR
jgi:hypothetical protein